VGYKLKVLIFGSRGLVGSSLARTLKNSNKISELILSTREDTNLFILDETQKIIHETMPDVIINAAAKVGGIVANNSYRTQFILENLKINMNILESSVPYPSIKIINLGSSCIYPLNAETPIKESQIMTGMLEPTNSPYSMAKLSAIEIGRAISSQYGHKILNLMPTNLYGPNDNFSKDSSHVIPGFFSRMYQKKIENETDFSIWGTGKPLREFLYVDELSEAIEFLLDKEVEHDLLNIGSGEEVSIKDLALKIRNLVQYDGEVNYDTSKPDGNPRKLIDSTLINNLGWKSKIDIDEGLEKTYHWFLNNFKELRI
jgi:GDP-L-fucose synthase